MTHGKSLLTSLGTLGPTNTVRLDVPQQGCGPHAVTAKPYVCPCCTHTKNSLLGEWQQLADSTEQINERARFRDQPNYFRQHKMAANL